MIKSLDAKYYTDPELYQLELKQLQSTTWQFAGHSSQLESVGDYFTFTIAHQRLFCIKNKDSEIKTYYNVCQHRAHELLAGSGNSKLIVCPYHAWSYDLNGRLRAAPNASSMVDFERQSVCLTSVKTELFCGFIFVNLDENAKSMDEWYPNVAQQLREYVPNIDDIKVQQWIEVPENCNWKISVENYSECYHCELNHPTFANGVVKPETYDIQPQGYCLRHTTECQNIEQMTYPIDLSSNKHAGHYSSWFLWPMFSFQVYPGNILNTYHWRPKAVDQVDLYRGWYNENGEHSNIVTQLAIQDRETTVAEDILLIESVHRGMNNIGYKPGPLVLDPNGGVKSEHSIKALQQWTREALEQIN